MEWPLEERDVAEQVGQSCGSRIAVRASGTLGQDNEWQVRPCGLSVHTRRYDAQVGGVKRLLRYDGKAGVVAKRPLESGKVETDFRNNAGFFQQGAGNPRVASLRSKDEDPAEARI